MGDGFKTIGQWHRSDLEGEGNTQPLEYMWFGIGFLEAEDRAKKQDRRRQSRNEKIICQTIETGRALWCGSDQGAQRARKNTPQGIIWRLHFPFLFFLSLSFNGFEHRVLFLRIFSNKFSIKDDIKQLLFVLLFYF